jgi:tetratricopeptide (TPR) repeat protein
MTCVSCVLFLNHISFSQQSKTDSLLTLATSYFESGKKHMKSGEDSLSIETFMKGINILEENEKHFSSDELVRMITLKAEAYKEIGMLYKSRDDYFKALESFSKALKFSEKLSDKEPFSSYLSQMGVVYKIIGNYSRALDYYFKALRADEEMGNEKDVALHLGNIGGIYFQIKDYSKAIDYVSKALQIHEKLGNKRSIALCLGNIGNIYSEQGEHSSALEYQLKALKIYEELKNERGIAESLGNIGSIYFNMGDPFNALEYYLKALQKTEKMNDKAMMAIQMGGIGSAYAALLKYEEAERYFNNAIRLCGQLGLSNDQIQIEEALSDLYEKTRKYKLAFEHYKIYAQLKDSVFSKEKEKDITRKEMNYEFEKKEAAKLAEHEKQMAIAGAVRKKQIIIIISVVVGLLLISFLLVVIIRSLKIARKQKAVIEEQKEISLNQKIILEKQKGIIEIKQKHILASIYYARRIQKAIVTPQAYIKQHLNNGYFVLFEPKDIVSGDFYWALHHHHKFYFITADSTGHGVPGAFMSLLNISLLNEAIIERSIKAPDEILNYVRDEIIKALNPDGIKAKRDGMDAILCCYDFNKMELQFASANNPLWLLRKGELTEYKADKMPVGLYDGELKSFTLQTISLQKDDIVYTITDGYADQFGGADNKKFGKKLLKNKLADNCNKEMKEQREILLKTFLEWKGEQEQIDDVSLVGVKI